MKSTPTGGGRLLQANGHKSRCGFGSSAKVLPSHTCYAGPVAKVITQRTLRNESGEIMRGLDRGEPHHLFLADDDPVHVLLDAPEQLGGATWFEGGFRGG